MNLADYIEHTLLKPDATNDEIKTLCEEAAANHFKCVCVNPINVKLAKQYLSNTNVIVGAAVGFPLGATYSEVKAYESELSIKNGATEIDMVMNISALKNKDYELVKNDIKAVKKACGQIPLKVILETDLLTTEEIKISTNIVCESGADFVKTSTGFLKNGVGAKVEDIKIMAEIAHAQGLKVKASGGIRDKEKALALIEVGADRLGTSSGIKIIN